MTTATANFIDNDGNEWTKEQAEKIMQGFFEHWGWGALGEENINILFTVFENALDDCELEDDMFISFGNMQIVLNKLRKVFN